MRIVFTILVVTIGSNAIAQELGTVEGYRAAARAQNAMGGIARSNPLMLTPHVEERKIKSAKSAAKLAEIWHNARQQYIAKLYSQRPIYRKPNARQHAEDVPLVVEIGR